MITVILSGLLLGLISSLHCVGMCGPLVMSLPFLGRDTSPALNLVIYNTGRITTYVLLGILFAFLGKQFYLAGFQKGLTILLGSLLLLFALIQFFPISKRKQILGFSWINKAIIHLSKKKSLGSLWLMGMFNGALPCGMVYLAIAASLAFQPIIHNAAYMLFFGIGTLPLLLGTGFLGWKINLSTRQKILKVIPIYSLILGVILILRGMELGIPFLSPILPQKLNEFIHCF